METAGCTIVYRPRELKGMTTHHRRERPLIVRMREVVTRMVGDAIVSGLRFHLELHGGGRISIEIPETEPRYAGYQLLKVGDRIRLNGPSIQDCLEAQSVDPSPVGGTRTIRRRTPEVHLA